MPSEMRTWREALLGRELVLSGSTQKALKAARSFTPREDLPTPRTKKDIGALVVITTRIDEARDKKVSLTSSKVRDILVGRWGGKKLARKIGIEVMRRAAKLCNVLLIGTVPGDLRETLQLTGEGPELQEAEISNRPCRYHSLRPVVGNRDRSPFMRESLLKSVALTTTSEVASWRSQATISPLRSPVIQRWMKSILIPWNICG